MVETPTRPKTPVRPMSEADRHEAWRLHKEGLGVREIARRFGRAPSTISRILRRPVPKVNAPRQPARAVASQTKAARAGTAMRARAMSGSFSRQELRSLEQRISRIESSLARVATLFRRARGGRKR